MSGPNLPDPEPVPEPESDTASRQALEIRRRRARGGRAKLILSNARAPVEGAVSTAARSLGSFATALGGSRGRGSLVNL